MGKQKKNRLVAIKCGDDTLNISLNGKNYVIDKSHANYNNILEELKKRHRDFKKLKSLLSIVNAIKRFSRGNVIVKGDQVYYKGQLIKSQIADFIIQFIEEGLDPKPLMKFLNNLMDNPSKWAVDTVVNFLATKGLPITTDGCFIGYKSVKQDYYDWYSGTCLNKVGAIFDMPRNQVDDDRLKDCSTGWHVGNIDYIKTFHPEGKILLIKVNPKDVISVPENLTCGKIRVCHYKVIGEHNKLESLKGSLSYLQ